MSGPVRWGLLSTALINRKLLAGARAAGVEVAAVASRDLTRARAYAEEHAIARAHGSYEALLADPDVDAVYVSLPNALHHPWTLRALEAGKHVLCEKPYSRRPEEVEAAFDLARARGLVLSEAYMYRYHPQIQRLGELVRDGAIGRLRVISSAFSWPCDQPGDVRLDPALDGGSLLDVGCYCVSAARALAGEPLEVVAHQVLGPTGVDVAFSGSLRFADDVLAHFDCGFFLPDRSSLEVVGETGVLRVRDPWHNVEPELVWHPQGQTPEVVEVAQANSYGLELQAVAAAIAGDPGAALGRADAVGQARALAALYDAAG